MRYYEKKKVTVDQDRLVRTVCDLCGKEAKWGNWGSGSYEINEVDIEVKIRNKKGESYPEGGWGTECLVDMCPQCFINKLIPWLKSEGAKIEEKEWEW